MASIVSDLSKIPIVIGGTIIGAITIGILLKSLTIDATIEMVQSQINRLFLIIPGIVCLFTVVATWGVEKKYSRFASRVGKQQVGSHLSLGRAIGILTASRQTQVFFTFLVVMTLGLFIQDPILETYGGEVFGLTVGETAQLNARSEEHTSELQSPFHISYAVFCLPNLGINQKPAALKPSSVPPPQKAFN